MDKGCRDRLGRYPRPRPQACTVGCDTALAAFTPATAALGDAEPSARRALDRLYLVAQCAPTVFSPDDYNPGNVLYYDCHVTGVVDWGEVTAEPRQAAVALYRHMLAIHPGGEAPALFLASYEDAIGSSLPDVALWDILYGLRALRPIGHWARAFYEHGLTLTEQDITVRSIAWIRHPLAQSANPAARPALRRRQ